IADLVPGGDRVRDPKLGDQCDADADLVGGEDLLSLDRLADLADVDAVDLPVFPAPIPIATRGEELDELSVAIEEAALVFADDHRVTQHDLLLSGRDDVSERNREIDDDESEDSAGQVDDRGPMIDAGRPRAHGPKRDRQVSSPTQDDREP